MAKSAGHPDRPEFVVIESGALGGRRDGRRHRPALELVDEILLPIKPLHLPGAERDQRDERRHGEQCRP